MKNTAHRLYHLLIITFALSSCGASLRAAITSDFTTQENWIFADGWGVQTVSRMETIGWGDRVYYFFANYSDGSLGYRAARIYLDSNDVPQIDNEGHQVRYSRGWDVLNLSQSAVIFGDDLYLFYVMRGGTSMDYRIMRKRGNGTGVTETYMATGTREIKLENAPEGYQLSSPTAFTLGGEIYLLVGNHLHDSQFPSIFRFNGLDKATYIGKLNDFGAPTSITPNISEFYQRYRSLTYLVEEGPGDSATTKEVAVISYQVDDKHVAVVAFDGEKVLHSAKFSRNEMGMDSDYPIESVSMARGALRGGPEALAPTLQLILTNFNLEIYGQAVELTKGGFSLKGKAQSYEEVDQFDGDIDTPEKSGVRGTSVALPSRQHRGALRRCVVMTGPGADGFYTEIDFNVTQSDVLRVDKEVAIDTQQNEYTEFHRAERGDRKLGTWESIDDPKAVAGLKHFWSVLGVITGPPPYTPTTATPASTIQVSRANSNITSISHSTSASVSGGPTAGDKDAIGGIGIDIGTSWSSLNSSSHTISFERGTSFNAPTDGSKPVGWILTYQPVVLASSFHEYSPDNRHSYDRTYLMYSVPAELNQTRGIVRLDFSPDKPNDAGSEYSHGMFGGDTAKSWPLSNNPEGYCKKIIRHHGTVLGRDNFPLLSTTFDSSENARAFKDSSNTKQRENTLSWGVKAVLPKEFTSFLGLFGIGGGEAYTTTRSQTTEFNENLFIQLSAIGGPHDNGVIDRFSLQPQLFYPAAGSEWLPTKAFPGATPWCITYKVSGLHKRNAQSSCSYTFGDIFEYENDSRFIYSYFLNSWLFEQHDGWFYDFSKARWNYALDVTSTTDFWIYNNQYGWTWTSEELMPWTYHTVSDTWVDNP